jgi:hypothetical protein
MDRVGSAKVPPSGWRNPRRVEWVPPKVPPYYIVWRNGATSAERVLRLRNAGRFRQGSANPSRGLFPRRLYWRRRRGPKQPHAVMGGALGAHHTPSRR